MYSENLDLLGNFPEPHFPGFGFISRDDLPSNSGRGDVFLHFSDLASWRSMIPGRAACGLFRSPVAGALCMVWFLSDGQTVEGLGNKSAVNAEKRNRKDRHLGIWKVMQGIPNQKPFHLDCSCGHYWQALSHGFDF